MPGGDLRRRDDRSWPGRSRAAARLLALVLLAAAPGASRDTEAGTPPGRPASPTTRADLAALRGRVALLESELALARSRKPYLIVDAGSRRLRYRLLGMTVREVAARDIDIDGLRRIGAEDVPGPPSLAGIVTLKEKDKDPRLAPLTPEQIEGGAADENVADALPPEAPADYALTFRQPVVLGIEGIPEKKTPLSRALSWWPRSWGRADGGDAILLRLTVHLDEVTAREVYRSLLPGERLIVVPPLGFLLPDAGQETPRSIRPGRPARPPVPQAGVPAPGVPFRIPPPLPETPAEGSARPDGAGEEPNGPPLENPPAGAQEEAPAPTATPLDPPPAS